MKNGRDRFAPAKAIVFWKKNFGQAREIRAFLQFNHGVTVAFVDRERAHIITVGKATVTVETVSRRRPIRRHLAKVLLAKERRGVIRLQGLGDRDFAAW